MSTTPISIDIKSISSNEDLLRLAEEVRKTRTPRALKKDNETIAVVVPVEDAAKPKKQRERTQADYEAFLSAAGSLKGFIDAEQLKKDIYESRKLITRPAFKL